MMKKRRQKRGVVPRVAATTDWRGDFDDELYLLFLNVPFDILCKAFDIMINNEIGIADGADIDIEPALQQIPGRAYEHYAVKIIGLNIDFIGLPADEPQKMKLTELKRLVQAVICSMYECSWKWVGINTFLNL